MAALNALPLVDQSGPAVPISRQDRRSQAVGELDRVARRRIKRQDRFGYKDHAHQLLAGIQGFENTCKCFRVVRKNHNASIVLHSDGTANYGGLARCGNVWACPVCAPHIAAHRASAIELVLNECLADGNDVYFMTFTCAHTAKMPYSWLLPALDKALVWFKAHGTVKAILKRLGYVDKLTAKDATWSEVNGWHPHRHEIWLYDSSKAKTTIHDEIDALREYWLRALATQGLTADPVIGLDVSESKTDQSSAERIGDYCTKISAAASFSMELASSTTKKGHKRYKGINHYTPFELLILSAQGDVVAGQAWLEYVKTMRGKRQIVMGRYLSALLKKLRLDDNFYADEKLACEDDDIVDSVSLEHGSISALLYYKKIAACLDVAELEGLDSAKSFADKYLEKYRKNCYDWVRNRLRFHYPDWFDPLAGMNDLLQRSDAFVDSVIQQQEDNQAAFIDFERLCNA